MLSATRHVPEQRVVLEHEADAALARADVRNVASVKGNTAVVHAGKAGDGAQQRALAAAAGAEQDEKLAIANIDGNVVDDGEALVPLGNLVEDYRHGAAMLPRRTCPVSQGSP